MSENSEQLTLNHRKVGSGTPMFMLHGGYLDHRHMMNEMEPVFEDRAGWMRVYIDLPNHGETGSSSAIRNFDDTLDLLLEFADSTFPGKRFAVSGMSAGGHLARGILAKRPRQVIGVMFNATPFVIDPEERDLPEPKTIFEIEGFEDLARNGTRMLRYVQPVRNKEMAAWYHENFAPARALLREQEATESWLPENYNFSFDLDAVEATFEGPSLILCGRQDTVVGYADGWPVAQQFPRATFAVLDCGGHMIEPTNRLVFRALVSDWMDRMECAEGL